MSILSALGWKRFGTVRAAFELGRNKGFALRRRITKVERLHIPGFLKPHALRNPTSGRNNWKASLKHVFMEIPTGKPIQRLSSQRKQEHLNLA